MAFNKKEYDRLYRLKNKEKMKNYRLINKEKIKEQSRLYKLKNKEKIKEYERLYRQTDAGKKSHRISTWKRRGIKDHYNDNYETIYKIYSVQKNCSICNKVFNETNRMDFKCLDHDHHTGRLRQVCCIYCNLKVVK